ncbi:hypothetical protein MPL3356_410016 [Mesorhizobium plurifarium]|uniref:Uncharacterized protein n=1 Tax=Mesorhizobium plurifarium TaxID=69974 RepID=A0A090EAY2_MESPL|nr:hypothetical protein MPL3356_410016 [Mesorhizobium plurifarium]
MGVDYSPKQRFHFLGSCSAPIIAPDAVIGHQLAQDTLAQAAVGDAQPLRRPDTADRFQDRAAGEHEVCAVGADAGVGATLLEIPADQPLYHAVDAVAVHPEAVDAAAVIAIEIEMHAGERRHRAGSAEQMEVGAGQHMREPVAAVEGLQPGGHVLDHCGKSLARHRAAAEALRERDDADGQRRPGDDVVGQTWRASSGQVDQRDLGRSAADVEQHHALGVALDQRAAAGNGQARLGLAVDDLELQPGLALDPVQELDTVGGRAAGLRRDQPGFPDLAVAQLLAADLQRLDRAVHGRLAEPAARRQPLAQPDDARESVDDPKLAVTARHRDQQPAIVGAEVERGKDGQFRSRRTLRGRQPWLNLRRRALRLACRRGGRRELRHGAILVAREHLAAALAFTALARLAFRLIAMLVGLTCAGLSLARMLGAGMSGVGMSGMRTRVAAESRRVRARRLRRRCPGQAHCRRARAGIVVFHFSSFRRRANRERTQQAPRFVSSWRQSSSAVRNHQEREAEFRQRHILPGSRRGNVLPVE